MIMRQGETKLETHDVDIDAGSANRAAIGLIVLKTDETIEHDLNKMIPTNGVRLYHNRIPMAPEVTPQTLASMQSDITKCASGFSENANLTAVGFGCTSGAMVIGEERISELIKNVLPGIEVSNPYTALKAALRTLNIKRLGIVSPYMHEISDLLGNELSEFGISIPVLCSFGQSEERIVARITPRSILEAIVRIGRDSDCDAVFASCTNLRAADVIADAEHQIRKPVLCSNQVLAWHLMRLAKLDNTVVGYGRLFNA